MTDYTDVPRANALHAESQTVAQALANLEAGGTISTMTVAPPPPTPPTGEPPLMPMMMMMAVHVTIPPPVDPAILADLTAWLNQRLVDIAAELTALGVTVPPQGSAAWSTSPAPPGMMPPPVPANPNEEGE